MATSSIPLNKENPNNFSLLYELSEYAQGKYLFDTLSFLDNIDDIDCLNALSKTCTFFNKVLNKVLLDRSQQIQEIYQPLVDEKIFENWQDVAKLPVLKEPLPNELDFSQEQIKNIPKSLMRGHHENHRCIIFKTIVRNSDGTFNSYNIELLVHFHSWINSNWSYASKRSSSIAYASIDDEVLSRHFKNLVKHQPASHIMYELKTNNSLLESMDLILEDWHPVRYLEYNTKISDDGKPIVELAPEDEVLLMI